MKKLIMMLTVFALTTIGLLTITTTVKAADIPDEVTEELTELGRKKDSSVMKVKEPAELSYLDESDAFSIVFITDNGEVTLNFQESEVSDEAYRYVGPLVEEKREIRMGVKELVAAAYSLMFGMILFIIIFS